MSHKILFVDDEPRVTKGLNHSLFEEDYEIFTADSAKEALEILYREPIEVVVSDEKMPNMTGSELLAIMRKNYPDTVRIILTGQASLDAAMKAINEGEIYRFLTKPCHGAELAITIRQALQHKILLAESRKLLEAAQQQAELLQELDTIPSVVMMHKRDAMGTVIIDTPIENVDELIQEMNDRVKRAEEIILNMSDENEIKDENKSGGI
ncbi:response regulator [Planctomycetota bacterium]